MATDRAPLQSKQFGPLRGVRIISSGTIIAQPFAAAMAAEMGAEVIQIERPGVGDIWRDLEFPVKSNGDGSTAAGWRRAMSRFAWQLTCRESSWNEASCQTQSAGYSVKPA